MDRIASSHHPFSRRLKRFAIAILVIGGLASTAVFLQSRGNGETNGGMSDIAETRELRQLERLGGKSALIMLKFQRWFESLWHGERLAITLAVSSILAAWLCLHLAALAEEDTDEEAGERAGIERQ